MESISDLSQNHSSQPAATFFARKNIAFETAKSTALGVLGFAAFPYGIIKIVEGVKTGHWTIKPREWELPICAGLGVLFGAEHGLDRFRNTQVFNSVNDTIEKYSNSHPEISVHIANTVGNPGGQSYQRTQTERYFSTGTNVSVLGLILNDIWLRKVTDAMENNWFGEYSEEFQNLNNKFNRLNILSNVLLGTTILCTLGGMGARIIGMSNWVKEKREEISHAEKIALERASVRSVSSLQGK